MAILVKDLPTHTSFNTTCFSLFILILLHQITHHILYTFIRKCQSLHLFFLLR